MMIYEARDAIAEQLEGDYHTLWVRSDHGARNQFLQNFAYGETTLEETVTSFKKWCDRQLQSRRLRFVRASARELAR